jgi:hypothetical protein
VGLSKAKIQLARPGSSHQRGGGGEQLSSTAAAPAATTTAAAAHPSSAVQVKEPDDADNKKGQKILNVFENFLDYYNALFFGIYYFFSA